MDLTKEITKYLSKKGVEVKDKDIAAFLGDLYVATQKGVKPLRQAKKYTPYKVEAMNKEIEYYSHPSDKAYAEHPLSHSWCSVYDLLRDTAAEQLEGADLEKLLEHPHGLFKKLLARHQADSRIRRMVGAGYKIADKEAFKAKLKKVLAKEINEYIDRRDEGIDKESVERLLQADLGDKYMDFYTTADIKRVVGEHIENAQTPGEIKAAYLVLKMAPVIIDIPDCKDFLQRLQKVAK